jgi:DNA primase
MADNVNTTLENIKDKLQIILNRKFANDSYIKRKIDVYHDRLNFSCPCCSDSRTDIRKKRGNLYLDSLSYHCYNCGEHMGINTLLHRFGEDLSSEDKIVVHEIQQSSKKFEKRVSSSQSSMSMTLLEKLAIPKMILFKQLGIISPYKNERASSYLKSRMIDIKDWKYFAYDPKTDELYILNTSPEDRVIGFQIRQLNPNSIKSRYISKRITRVYSDVFNKDINGITERLLLKESLGQKYIDEEDGIENIVANLDRLSGIFNIMNVNLSQPLTIMEGPIDSLAVANSIALQGASKQLDGFFDEVENVRYIFDNDKTGKEMTLKKLKNHKKVFLWGQYLNMIHTKLKVKDLNDLQKMNLLNPEIIEKCFSDDEFDAMYI